MHSSAKNVHLAFFFIILQNVPIKLGYEEYGCPFCQKITKRKDYMQKHILIHTGEKPFNCQHCGKRFNRKDNCIAHMKKCIMNT